MESLESQNNMYGFYHLRTFWAVTANEARDFFFNFLLFQRNVGRLNQNYKLPIKQMLAAYELYAFRQL